MFLEEKTGPIQNRHKIENSRDDIDEVVVDCAIFYAREGGDQAEPGNDKEKKSKSKSLKVMSYICHNYAILKIIP